MYSKEMEDLIEVTLADGKLTDQEKQVLVKRAEDEGIDLNELDVYIQSILYKKNQSAAEQESAEEREHKHGYISRCPNCGAAVSGIEAKCSQCGYEFHGLEANKSSQKLADLINKAEGDDKYQKKVDIILNFPVPSTKEDLMEFLITMTSKEKVTSQFGDEKLKKAYRAKMSECITKARISFGGDPTMQQIIAEAQAALDVPLKNMDARIIIWLGIVVVVFCLIIGFLEYLVKQGII